MTWFCHADGGFDIKNYKCSFAELKQILDFYSKKKILPYVCEILNIQEKFNISNVSRRRDWKMFW